MQKINNQKQCAIIRVHEDLSDSCFCEYRNRVEIKILGIYPSMNKAKSALFKMRPDFKVWSVDKKKKEGIHDRLIIIPINEFGEVAFATYIE